MLALDQHLPNSQWPYPQTLARLGLALAIGLFVGLERERQGKEAGLRTFGFTALLGCLGGVLGDYYPVVTFALLAILVIFLNVQRLWFFRDTELTTSAAIFIIGFAGVLCGQGHTLTPAAVGVVTVALLAWKERLSSFSVGLTEAELQSAVLLAILAFVIYPALPEGSVDPWDLVHPRQAWVTVILIAAIGFGNYVLFKLYGSRAVELTGFFGGLLNSTVAVAALASRVREERGLADVAYRGILLATAAMLVRNGALLGILSPAALVVAIPALALMLLGSFCLLALRWRERSQESPSGGAIQLRSPLSLFSVLQFGLIFLGLEVAGTLGQRSLGQLGFYAVSLIGGLISSASAVASAGTLAARGSVPPGVAGTGAVLASLTSALINLPLVARVARDPALTRQVALSLAVIILLGMGGAVFGMVLLPSLIGDGWTGAGP